MITPDVPSNPCQAVVHDHGDFWPGALVRHQNGDVTGAGNPWLGGGCREISVHANDMARLDALSPAANEHVVVVGSGGLRRIRWDASTGDYVVSAASITETFGAQLVRTAPFSPHTVVTVKNTASPASAEFRMHRASGAPNYNLTYLATFTLPQVVHDFVIVHNAANYARLIVRTDTGVTCYDPAGNSQWSVAGTGGVLIRWPWASTSVRAGWLRPAGTNWELVRLKDSMTTVVVTPCDAAFDGTQAVTAGFATDLDDDGLVTLVVKTSGGVRMLEESANETTAFETVTVSTTNPSPGFAPDLVVTHGGSRMRLVDANGDELHWSSVRPINEPDEDDGIALETQWLGDDEVGAVHNPGTGTQLDCKILTTGGVLDEFHSDGTATRLQVMAWRQADTLIAGTVSPIPESNRIFTLAVPETSPIEDERWLVDFTLNPPVTINEWTSGDRDALYWVMMRLVNTPEETQAMNFASDPVVFLVSAAALQANTGWQYIVERTVPPLLYLGTLTEGGGIVGVIQKSSVRPPPPPDAIPNPISAAPAGTLFPL